MMSASHLSAALRAAIASKSWANNSTELTEFCDALAAAIVAEVQLAVVTVPGTGLVAPGGGGPVTGVSVTGNLT